MLNQRPGKTPNYETPSQRFSQCVASTGWTHEGIFSGVWGSSKRATATKSLIQSARMTGHDPYAYLNDVLARLRTQRASEMEQLLPHQWIPG